jgi:hypothetical protein
MEEKRRSPREDVFTTIMISPNGHENRATVYNVSESGARVGLPPDFKRNVGAPVRLFFTVDEDETIVLEAEVVRVAVDHLGVQFMPSQEEDIRHVMREFTQSR